MADTIASRPKKITPRDLVREHAALHPKYLGKFAVIAIYSYAGCVLAKPCQFLRDIAPWIYNFEDYGQIEQGDTVAFKNF